jgi:hypothetical protein
MNVPDWIRGTAEYMAKVRSDIYDYERAHAELVDHMEHLREEHGEDAISAIMSGSFIMLRLVEDEGQEEFQVAQYISSVTTFQPEEECVVIGNTRLGVNLPGPNDPGETFSDEGLTDY